MSTSMIESTLAARALEPRAGERVWIAGDTMWFKATAAETGGAYTLIEVLASPGGGPPPHIHAHEEESFFVLEGEFEITIGERLVHATPGTFALVPRGTVHRFRCVGERPGRILLLFTPGGLERFFREAGTAATHDGPAPAIDAAEISRTEAAAARYGLRVVHWSS